MEKGEQVKHKFEHHDGGFEYDDAYEIIRYLKMKGLSAYWVNDRILICYQDFIIEAPYDQLSVYPSNDNDNTYYDEVGTKEWKQKIDKKNR